MGVDLIDHRHIVMSVAQAATLMGTTEKAIRQRVARRLLPFHKLGGRVIFLRGELAAFLSDLPGCRPDEAAHNVRARNETKGMPC